MDPIRLRYQASCAECGRVLARGERAFWDKATKQASCATHEPGTSRRAGVIDTPPSAPDDAPAEGQTTRRAGESAQREYERRRANREKSIRAKHRTLGGLILALTDDPQSTRAWAIGAEGERRLGARLDEVVDGVGAVLHDRRILGTRANIDHMVIMPSGVFVVDAKNYQGKVEKRDVGGWFRRDERLYVGGRDRSKLVEGVREQVAVVREVLGTTSSSPTSTFGMLCFLRSEWSLFARPIRLGDVEAIWPKALVDRLSATGELTAAEIEVTTNALAERFPPA